ncbi:MAG: sigma-70 family RNA polymerase sigma factor [Spirulina sp. SIO3F2]|nr:sigma-70 family RNA polymerase sigma factor [Spirulina sp. SIO3F2]
MDDLDSYLKDLALEAQKHPLGKERQILVEQLLRAIQTSGRLGHPYREQFPHLYDQIYEEAKQRLHTHIYRRIDEYRPEKEVMQWVNFIFKRRFFYEARQEVIPHYRPSSGRAPWLNLEDLQALPPDPMTVDSPQSTPEVDIRTYVETDPSGVLSTLHIQGRPDITLQRLLLRYLDGYRWHEIATELDVSPHTIYRFYRRGLDKLNPLIKDYLEP